jgi:uncharacterized protein with PQ loop repeat
MMSRTVSNILLLFHLWLNLFLLFISTGQKQCIQNKNADSLTLTMMIPGTLCSGAWATYGFLLKDFYIYVSLEHMFHNL